jgi:hypothetical protein
MSEAGIKLSKSKITQTIDLNDVIGSDISSDEVLVNRIGQAIIDYMENRVSDGRGLDNVKLKSPYSDSYADSLNFKAAGKTKNNVNMKLSGDMLGSIDLLKVDGSKLTIGIEDPDQAIKAYGHQTGFEGHPFLKGPKRPFFGVSTEELKKKVLTDFKKEIEAKKVTSFETQSKMINLIRGIKTLGDLLK